jgi:hypothetical protein
MTQPCPSWGCNYNPGPQKLGGRKRTCRRGGKKSHRVKTRHGRGRRGGFRPNLQFPNLNFRFLPLKF